MSRDQRSADLAEADALPSPQLNGVHRPSAKHFAHLGRQVAEIAHDLNNVLSVLTLRLDRMHNRSLDPKSTDDLSHAVSALEAATHIVRNILTIQESAAEQPEVIDVVEQWSVVEPLLRDLLGAGIDLDWEVRAAHRAVALAASRFTQIMINLAVNARDAMPGGGSVRVSIVYEPVMVTPPLPGEERPPSPRSYVRVDFADTGHGIEPGLAAEVFKPFVTTKHEPSRVTGLGLATVHDIVTRAQGFITLQSAVGQGCTFSFWLPAEHADVDEPQHAQDSHGETGVDPPTVVLMVDEVELSAMLADGLGRRGYDVRAVDRWRPMDLDEQDIDILVTDLHPQNERTVDHLREVMALRPDLHVIFTSGQPEHLAGNEAGQMLLVSPFTVEQLDLAIRSISLDA